MAWILIIVITILTGLGVPAAVDVVAGNAIQADDQTIYSIERFGEAVRSAFGGLSGTEIANERLQEAGSLAQRGLPEKATEILGDAETALLNVPSSQREPIQIKVTALRTAIQEGRAA